LKLYKYTIAKIRIYVIKLYVKRLLLSDKITKKMCLFRALFY